jgi:hypothetical protein
MYKRREKTNANVWQTKRKMKQNWVFCLMSKKILKTWRLKLIDSKIDWENCLNKYFLEEMVNNSKSKNAILMI